MTMGCDPVTIETTSGTTGEFSVPAGYQYGVNDSKEINFIFECQKAVWHQVCF